MCFSQFAQAPVNFFGNSLASHLRSSPYAIVQPERHSAPLHFISRLIDAGVRTFQIRAKSFNQLELKKLIDAAAACIHQAHGILIVNDHAELAADSKADGLHLGQDDMTVEHARALLGSDKIIGLSTHNMNQFQIALGQAIDYVALGPIFTSKTKFDHAPEVGCAVLNHACKLTSIPVVAIGGINTTNIQQVVSAGATTPAVIGDLEECAELAEAELIERVRLLSPDQYA